MATIKEDLLGQKFGKLTVVSFHDFTFIGKQKYSQWKCECDCGNEVIVSRVYLTKGTKKSCGCIPKGPNNGKYKIEREIKLENNPKETIFDLYYDRLVRLAQDRGIDWELCKELVFILNACPCHYCNSISTQTYNIYRQKNKVKYIAAQYHYNGLDRKNSKIGYTPENTVTCCSLCNMAKNSLPEGEFIEWVFRISNYQRNLLNASK